MKSVINISLILFLFPFFIWAQNLVPNSSFEDTVSCPTNISQLNKTKFWLNPTQSSPDYFNACDPNPYNANVPYTAFGFQGARTGQAIAGFYTGGPCLSPQGAREYVQIALTSTLTGGAEYSVSFNINLSNWARYATSKIGAYISVLAPTRNDMLVINAVPQIENNQGFITDTLNWIQISGTYTAQGGEQYITIGNFYDENNTDTLNMGLGFLGYSCHYYYIDDVSVIDSATGISYYFTSGMLKVFPNPATDFLNIESKLSDAEIKIYDLLGNEIKKQKLGTNTSIDVSGWSNGVYQVRVFTPHGNLTKKIIIQH